MSGETPGERVSGSERLARLPELVVELGIQAFLAAREMPARQIVSEARKHINSLDWAEFNNRPPYGQGQNKCNLFVYEVLNAAGTPVFMRVRWSWREMGNVSYPPLAEQWANPYSPIPGWQVVKDPRPGDVAAMKEDFSDASGHVGIVSGPGTTISASSETSTIVENDWGFRPEQQGQVVFRRYVGISNEPVKYKEWPHRGRIAP